MTNSVADFLRETTSVRAGDWSEALPLIYEELRSQAASILGRQAASCTLQPTALAHDAWIRLSANREFESREHFLAVAAVTMRGILVDHARARAAAKRGGDRNRITLSAVAAVGPASGPDLVDLNDVLEKLAAVDARRARVVELRVFGGLTHPEIARVLGISLSGVEADWRFARAWLAAHWTDSRLA
jgi:RNA polymerase sigma-70 factor (ECF subfamily)